MKTGTENTTKTNEEIIAELREQLKKAQEKKDKGCKTSTLKKIGKTTLGLGLLAAAGAAGFYYGMKESGNTTVVISE